MAEVQARRRRVIRALITGLCLLATPVWAGHHNVCNKWHAARDYDNMFDLLENVSAVALATPSRAEKRDDLDLFRKSGGRGTDSYGPHDTYEYHLEIHSLVGKTPRNTTVIGMPPLTLKPRDLTLDSDRQNLDFLKWKGFFGYSPRLTKHRECMYAPELLIGMDYIVFFSKESGHDLMDVSNNFIPALRGRGDPIVKMILKYFQSARMKKKFADEGLEIEAGSLIPKSFEDTEHPASSEK